MTRRARHLLTGLAAAAALAAVLVGVPAALTVTIGWPLPTTVPSWDQLAHALTGGDIADRVWLNVIACVVWAAWANFAAAVVVEVVAGSHGRAAPPVTGIPAPARAAAAHLVTAAALILVSLAPRPGVAHALAPLPTATLIVEDHAEPPRPTVDTGPLAVEEAPAKSWTVTRRQTLWGIAERTLGNGERWHELWDLNRDRPQPDGRALRDPALLEPGWVLRLPPDATVTTAPAGHHVVAPGDSLWSIAEGRAGDGERWHELWDLNHGRTQADGRALTDPDLLTPGWALQLPTTHEPEPAAQDAPGETPVSPPTLVPPAPTAATVAPPPVAPDRPAVDPPAPPSNPNAANPSPTAPPPSTGSSPPDGDDRADLPVGLIGGGLGLAGVMLTLDRLRRVQQRRRAAGRRIRLPDATVADAETALRARSDVTLARRLDLALRAIGDPQGGSGDVPDITHIRVGPDGITVHLTTPATPPPGFLADTPTTWRLNPSVTDDDLHHLAASAAAPLPLLASVGSDGDHDVLIDFEAVGVLAVTGDPTNAVALLEAVAAGVATSPWSDDVEVILVGVGHDIHLLPWVRVLPSLADALDVVEARAAEAADALRFAGVATPLAGRVTGTLTEAWEPTVVVCAQPPTADDQGRLTRLASRTHHCVAVVLGGDVPDAPWQAIVDADGQLHLPPLATTLHAHRLDNDTAALIDQLLATATDTSDVAPVEIGSAAVTSNGHKDPPVAVWTGPPSGHDEPGEPGRNDGACSVEPGDKLRCEELDDDQSRPGEPEDDGGDRGDQRRDQEGDDELGGRPGVGEVGGPVGGGGVEVRVLGEVGIVGPGDETVAFDRAKSAEAVTYLALHPGGATKDALQSALWPDGTNAEGTWHQTISKARRDLGAAPDGTEHFPPVNRTGGRYRLGPDVGSDYDRFRQLTEEASGAKGATAADTWAAALSLVRGEPLSGRGVAYAWRAGLAATIEAEIVDAADTLAQARLASGDPRGAEWAARRGLAASPYDERLYRLLMRAADAAGNPAGVHKVLRELAAKLEVDIEPLDSLHPETVALFEDLTGRGRRASA